ncbi:hypothetical protein VOLCADRAFT_107036, partial [Volvox carteri f. nagariensis]
MSLMPQPKDCPCIWVPGLLERVAHYAGNDAACTLRVLNKEAAEWLTNFKERRKLLELTAASGIIENLKVARANVGLADGLEDMLKAAAAAGQLEMCQLLKEETSSWGLSLPAASRGGHRHVCEWMLAAGCPLSSMSAVEGAARGGHEGLMNWLWEEFLRRGGSTTDSDIENLLIAAAEGFDLAALQRLKQHSLPGEDIEGQQRMVADAITHTTLNRMLAAAAGSATSDWLAKMEWLEAQGGQPTVQASESAAGSPHDALGRLQWLRSRDYPLDESVADAAAAAGNPAALQYLVAQMGIRPTAYGITQAFQSGHLAVLQYLHSVGLLAQYGQAVENAAINGRLAVVCWVVEALGLTPDNTADLLNSAARSGNTRLMTWLHEWGWSWKSRPALENAIKSGCQEAVEWLLGRDCRVP